MPHRRALLVAAVLLAVSAPLIPAHATEPSIESRVFAHINDMRDNDLVVHSGLLSVAREHSRGMAQRGGLDHNNADARIRNASPDPVEANGAPDDGSPPASWCENVTYSVGTSEAEAEQRIYEAWERSGSHHRCMDGESRNVGAVGIYYDGQSWWATFIAMVDDTPPGGARRPAAERTAAPEPEAQPRPSVDTTEQPRSSPEGLITSIDQTPAHTSAPSASVPGRRSQVEVTLNGTVNHPGGASSIEPRVLPTAPVAQKTFIAYGWQELSAVVVLLLLATAVLARSINGAPEVERRDHVPFAVIETVRPDPARV